MSFGGIQEWEKRLLGEWKADPNFKSEVLVPRGDT